MTINEYIDNFLRDAQYRVGTLSAEIDEIGDDGSYRYEELFFKRLELTLFMDVVYEGKWYITDGYNHIQYTTTSGTKTGWTEREVIQEIEHLRYYTEMNEVPFVTFTAHYPQIVNPIGSGGSGSGTGSLPAGQFGQIMGFNAIGEPVAQNVDPYGGHIDGEPIAAYFSGRLWADLN
jgi:hypothetical protein